MGTTESSAPALLKNNAAPMPSRVPDSLSQPTRFLFIDGLRGMAALIVTLFHIGPWGELSFALQKVCPGPVFSLLRYGYLGVAVFFVLSGFVIAYSLRNALVTPRFLGRFALRRSIRLDPPYWGTILLALLINAVLNPMRPGRAISFPPFKILLAHLTYTQELFRFHEISGPFWTLCYEVQFYLVFVILLGLAKRIPLSNRPFAGFREGSRFIIFVPLAIVSLLTWMGRFPALQGLFIYFWFSFFIGVLVWWTLEGSVSPFWLWISVLSTLLSFLALRDVQNRWVVGPWSLVACGTGIAIYLAGYLGRMDRWLSSTWIQFFGRISYSLYLVHSPVGNALNSLGIRVCGKSIVLALGWIALTTIVSIGAGYLMYVFIERPAQRLSRRLTGAPTPQLLKSSTIPKPA